MGNTLKDKIAQLKKEKEIEYVSFFNDGTNCIDNYGFAKKVVQHDSIEGIKTVLYNAAQSYSYDSNFDEINMGLLIGLVYPKKYVNDDLTLTEDAVPLEDFVRFYTGHINSYLEGMQTNRADYYYYGCGRQGYVCYSELVEAMKSEKLIFNGPETFEAFVEQMKQGVPFDISLTADLKEDMALKLEQ